MGAIEDLADGAPVPGVGFVADQVEPHLGSELVEDVSCAIGRSVVEDEDVRSKRADAFEHGSDSVLFVVDGDRDECSHVASCVVFNA